MLLKKAAIQHKLKKKIYFFYEVDEQERVRCILLLSVALVLRHKTARLKEYWSSRIKKWCVLAQPEKKEKKYF